MLHALLPSHAYQARLVILIIASVQVPRGTCSLAGIQTTEQIPTCQTFPNVWSPAALKHQMPNCFWKGTAIAQQCADILAWPCWPRCRADGWMFSASLLSSNHLEREPMKRTKLLSTDLGPEKPPSCPPSPEAPCSATSNSRSSSSPAHNVTC